MITIVTIIIIIIIIIITTTALIMINDENNKWETGDFRVRVTYTVEIKRLEYFGKELL